MSVVLRFSEGFMGRFSLTPKESGFRKSAQETRERVLFLVPNASNFWKVLTTIEEVATKFEERYRGFFRRVVDGVLGGVSNLKQAKQNS